MDIRKLLEEYKKLIIILIDKANNVEDLEEWINKSNDILKEIKKINYNDEELKRILKEFNIEELENELRLTIKKEMVKIKKKIEHIKVARNARKMYRASTQLELNLFQKKI